MRIWKHGRKAVKIGGLPFDLADELEEKHLYRFAEQLRGGALSVPNDIAEGSGNTSNREFRQFLNIACRSVSEVANMIIIFNECGLIDRQCR